MKNNDFNQKGGTKKFLYTGVKKDLDDQEDLPWNFGSKNNYNTKKPVDNSKFELDDVWSIKRNVNVAGGSKEPKADPLAFSTNKSYYSRYGGNSTNGTEEKPSWSTSNTQSQRPFSFSYGTDQTAKDNPSPRQVSVSSTGAYTQSNNTNTFGTRYPRSQGSDKSSSNNNALFGNGAPQNRGGFSSPVGTTYQNGGSLTSRESNIMMSTGGRHSVKGRFMSTRESDFSNRSKFQSNSQFNQHDHNF